MARITLRRIVRALRVRPGLPAALAVIAAAALALAANEIPFEKPPVGAPGARPGGGPRLREGTSLVDVPGYFKMMGDRATFYTADDKERFGGLENLNLERIAVAMDETPDQLDWIVSGTITEYRGSNHLLVTRAVLKTKPAGSDRSGRRKTTTEGPRGDSPPPRAEKQPTGAEAAQRPRLD